MSEQTANEWAHATQRVLEEACGVVETGDVAQRLIHFLSDESRHACDVDVSLDLDKLAVALARAFGKESESDL